MSCEKDDTNGVPSYIKINEEGTIWTSSMSDLYNNHFQRNHNQ